MKTRIHDHSEKNEEFQGQDIGRLVKTRSPINTGNFVHQINVNSFVDGVNDVKLYHALRLSWQKNLYEAVIYALAFEEAKIFPSCKNCDNSERWKWSAWDSKDLYVLTVEKNWHFKSNCKGYSKTNNQRSTETELAK